MERNAKTILLAVFILLIAIVSFNFTGMTGEITRNKGVLEITSHPNGIVHRGETIRVKVTPGSKGIDNRYMYVYRINGARIEGTKAWICGRYGSICKKPSTVVYNSLGTYDPVKWSLGKYIVKAKEHNGDYVTAKFTLEE